MTSRPRLVSIGLSHYVDKARWALERAGVAYDEEPHAPLFHRRATRRAGGGRTVPILLTAEGALTDSTDILRWADARGAALWPADPDARARVDQLEDDFDRRLGPAARRLMYCHLVDSSLLHRMVTVGAPPAERRLIRLMMPLLRLALKKGYGLHPRGAAKARERIDQVFADVAALLADGRSFLTGDSFTAADLTFAALAAPLLLPPEYGVPLPAAAELPTGARALVEELRATPAGAFALRLYAQQRRTPAARAA